MPVNLKGRSLLTLKDYTPDEIRYLLNLAADLKAKKRAGIRGDLLEGKNIVLLFEKTSTRTRCAFEVAALDEGAHVTFLSNSQMGKKESLEDTAKVLGRFYDGIEFRGFKQETVELLAKHAGVPVWNGLTDMYHPTQVLADCLTIMENVAKPLNKVKLVYVGDARNNMGNSLMIISAKLACIASPPSMISRPPSAATSMSVSALPSRKLPTKYSAAPAPRSLTRLRTACTPSRPSWLRPPADKLNKYPFELSGYGQLFSFILKDCVSISYRIKK